MLNLRCSFSAARAAPGRKAGYISGVQGRGNGWHIVPVRCIYSILKFNLSRVLIGSMILPPFERVVRCPVAYRLGSVPPEEQRDPPVAKQEALLLRPPSYPPGIPPLKTR